MKRLRILLTAGVSLLALTAEAAADPVTIGSWILVNLLPALIGSGIGAAAVGYAAIAAATIGLNIGLAALNKQKIKPQDYKGTFSTGESSEIRSVGRIRVGGLKIFGNTSDINRYRLIAHTKGPISAVEAHYLGGREVTVEADGWVSSPPYARPQGASTASYVRVEAKTGDGTETAWSALTSAFTAWTSNHRVRGIAQSLVRYISPGIGTDRFLKMYQNFPEYERVQRCEPVYDPRDGGQSVDTQSTWGWSENGILCAAHILRSYPNFTSADFDWTGIGAQATLAEVAVDTLTGSEDRARCWGLWPSENPRNDVMQQVLESIGADIVSGTDDKILIRLIDDAPTAEIAFTAKHIINIDRRYGPESVERPNLCVVKYYSPERNYDMGEIDMTGIAWARIEDEIDRYGEKTFVVELPFCPSASQAQRIARRLFRMARADAGVATLNMAGLAAWGLRYVSLYFPDIDVTELCAIGTPRVNDDEGTVEIPFVVWPDLPTWDEDVDEAPAPPDIPELEYAGDLTKPSTPSAATYVEYTGGGKEVRVSFTFPAGGSSAEALLRLYTGGLAGAPLSMTEVITGGTMGAGGSAIAWRNPVPDGIVVGNTLDFRVRIFNADDEPSPMSDALSVGSLAINNTAPTAPVITVTGANANWAVSCTSGGSLQVSYIRIFKQLSSGGGIQTVSTQDARPGGTYNATVTDSIGNPTTLQIWARAFSSNGTQSAQSNIFTYAP